MLLARIGYISIRVSLEIFSLTSYELESPVPLLWCLLLAPLPGNLLVVLTNNADHIVILHTSTSLEIRSIFARGYILHSPFKVPYCLCSCILHLRLGKSN